MYYFGIRVIKPTGSWVLCGPYKTRDQAKAAYDGSKASDVEVCPWFVADDKAMAEARLASMG